MDSSKARTNKRWTSSQQHRENWDRIFAAKEPDRQADVEAKLDQWRSNAVGQSAWGYLGWTKEQFDLYRSEGVIP